MSRPSDQGPLTKVIKTAMTLEDKAWLEAEKSRRCGFAYVVVP